MQNCKVFHLETKSGIPLLYGMVSILCKAYEDYFNNYVSYKTYAEHNGITEEQSLKFIELAKEVYYSANVDY